MSIHPTAIISPQATIHPSVQIDPYVIIEGQVTIDAGCHIESHAILKGPLTLGTNNHIHPHAVLGGPPQDLKYQGEETSLHIGNDNIFREFVTVNRGTALGQSKTSIGHGNLLMAYCHVAHDCVVENHCVLANGATLAGHIHIADNAIIGGLSALHQHVRVGRLAMIAGGSMVSQDIPPFMLAQGDRAIIRGLNRIGLRRYGFNKEQIKTLQEAYKHFAQQSSRQSRLEYLHKQPPSPLLQELISCLEESTRGICKYKEV